MPVNPNRVADFINNNDFADPEATSQFARYKV
jgi:hypothetical protein